MEMKRYLELLSLPLFFIILYTLLFVSWRVFDLPEAESLIEITRGWFDKYGLPILFLSSILEGLLLVGSYFPGVLVIFLGVLLSSSFTSAMVAVLIGTLGLLVAHITNYFLGKYGWYRLLGKFGMTRAIERARENLVQRGPVAILLSYWMPSIGALTNTAAGIIQMPFRIFIRYSVFSSILWYFSVGIIVYFSGVGALEFAAGGTGVMFTYTFLLVWIALVIARDERKRGNR